LINTSGFPAVLDHHITINWDDGPTLHHIAAQVRYRFVDSTSGRTVRVKASQRYSDEPLSFMVLDDGLRASWVWQERGPGWTAQLAVQNDGDEDVLLDALDVIRIDSAFGGLFNMGAPPGLWQVSAEDAARGLLSAPAGAERMDAGRGTAESWAPGTIAVDGFIRRRQLVVQPSVSNRSRPPAVMIRALGTSPDELPTEIRLEVNGERFERLSARVRADGLAIASGVVLASPEFWVVAGDDADELKRLEVE
jgi:hypothetical protein